MTELITGYNPTTQRVEAQGLKQTPPETPIGEKILITGENFDHTAVLGTHLTDGGYSASFASDATESTEAAKFIHPAVMVFEGHFDSQTVSAIREKNADPFMLFVEEGYALTEHFEGENTAVIHTNDFHAFARSLASQV